MALITVVSAEFDGLHKHYNFRLAKNADDKSFGGVSITIECPLCIVTKKTPQQHHLSNLLDKSKRDGASTYQSTFTCSTCKTDISPKELVTGDSMRHQPLKVPETKNHRIKLAERICYRQYIEILVKDKYPKEKYSKGVYKKIATNAKKGRVEGVDASQVSKMLRRPMKIG